MIRKLFSSKDSPQSRLKNLIGFKPGNVSVYHTAFLHSTAAEKDFESNERLEYLGDAILGAVIADFLYRKFPYKNEGYLTDIRSKVVSRTQLNTIAMKMGLDQFIVHESVDPMLNKRTLAGNALEALVGAIYMDKGFSAAQKFVLQKIIQPFIDFTDLEISEFNYKSKLLEWAQRYGRSLSFEVREHSRNGSRNIYRIAALIDQQEFGIGEDSSKKKAEKVAAKNAFVSLKISVEEFI